MKKQRKMLIKEGEMEYHCFSREHVEEAGIDIASEKQLIEYLSGVISKN